MQEALRKKIAALPLLPGIYFFKDSTGTILYVGKAKKLRNRVRSYFGASAQLPASKQMMVKKIHTIETIITSNESEALILESIHIKKHRPPYNVALKDDKHYRFVKIDYRHTRPIVTTVRRPEQDTGRSQSRYFGPYTSSATIQETLRFLRRVFPFRKKPKALSPFEEALLRKRTLGPIPETDDEYQHMIQRFIRVLEGRGDAVITDLEKRMHQLSTDKHFEKAAAVRDQIRTLRTMQSRQNMVSVKGESQDVVSIHHHGPQASANVFIIRMGRLLDKLNFILDHTEDENLSSVTESFVLQYYGETSNPPKELILPARINATGEELRALWTAQHEGDASGSFQHITIPVHGRKKDLMTLGEENAREFLEQRKASWESSSDASSALAELQKQLGLPRTLKRIEGYDISNIQGTFSVGSMVVFTDGKPDKNEYRKFKIKSIKGSNDFASLAEVLKRRLSEENRKKWKQPDVILLDGGKGQLSAVIKTLFSEKNKSHGITADQFIALAKREEEVFQGASFQKIHINPQSEASRLLQRIRDEAHRFAQQYYHARHAKADIKSVLDDVPGIGPKTKKQLIQAFGSVSGIRAADANDIVKIIGKAKTEKLLENI